MTAYMCDLCHRPAVRNGRCEEHQTVRFSRNTSETRKRPRKRTRRRNREHPLKNDRLWHQLSAKWLADNPWCEACKRRTPIRGGPRWWPATEVDHIVPVTIDFSRRYDHDNVQSLCASCHGRKGQMERRGQYVDYRRGVILHVA